MLHRKDYCKHGLTPDSCWTCRTGEKIKPEGPGKNNLCQLIRIFVGLQLTWWMDDEESDTGVFGGAIGGDGYASSGRALMEDNPNKPYFIIEGPTWVCRKCKNQWDSWHRFDLHQAKCTGKEPVRKQKPIEETERPRVPLPLPDKYTGYYHFYRKDRIECNICGLIWGCIEDIKNHLDWEIKEEEYRVKKHKEKLREKVIKEKERRVFEKEAEEYHKKTGIKQVYLTHTNRDLRKAEHDQARRQKKQYEKLPIHIRAEIEEAYEFRKPDLQCRTCGEEVPILLSGECYPCFVKRIP